MLTEIEADNVSAEIEPEETTSWTDDEPDTVKPETCAAPKDEIEATPPTDKLSTEAAPETMISSAKTLSVSTVVNAAAPV